MAAGLRGVDSISRARQCRPKTMVPIVKKAVLTPIWTYLSNLLNDKADRSPVQKVWLLCKLEG